MLIVNVLCNMNDIPEIVFFEDKDSSALPQRWRSLIKEQGLAVKVAEVTDGEALLEMIGEGRISLLVIFPGVEIPSFKGVKREMPPVLLVDRPALPAGQLPAGTVVNPLDGKDENSFLFMLRLMQQHQEKETLPERPDYDLLQRIFRSAEELILVTRGDHLVFFNDKVAQFLGKDAQYLREHSFWEFIHPDDIELLKEKREKRLTGELESVPYVFRIRTANGEISWMKITGYLIDWEGQPATLNFITPIDEKLQAEKKIRNMEAFLWEMLEFSPLGIIVLDREMTVVQINRSLSEKIGQEPDTLRGNKIQDIAVFSEAEFVEKLYLNEEQGDIRNEITAEITLNCPGNIVRDYLVSKYYSSVEGNMILWFTEVTEKNRIMNGLRRSEKRYRDLMETMHEGILGVDPEGNILESNDAVRNLLGYDKDGFREKKYQDVTPSFWQPLEKKIFRELFEDGAERKYEKEFIHADGSMIITEVHALRWNDLKDEGLSIWLFIRDITQEKSSERDILERELRYRTILEYSPLPLLSEDYSAVKEYLWQLGNLGVEDVDTYLKAHPDEVRKMAGLIRPLEASQKALEFFEVKTVEELADAYSNQDYPDEVIEKIAELFVAFLKGENVYEAEIISLTKYGDKRKVIVRWVLVPGHELSWDMVLVAITDLSERLQYEEQLQVLSRAISNSPVSVVITNAEGTIEFVNPKFTEVTGYTSEESIGQNPRILKSGNLPDSFYKNLWDTITQGKVWQGEFENKKKNGEIFWEHASISGIRNNKGEIAYYVAIKEDITERKKTELELIRAKEKAEESDRLKTAFLANMSHEIRTPLNAIIGFTGMLHTDTLEPQLREEYFAIINQSSQALLNLIDDIIDVSKIEAGHIRIIPHKIDITGLMKELYTGIKRDLLVNGKDVKASLTIPWGEEFIIHVDSFRLKQILQNILNNAVKFTEKGEIEFGYRLKSNDTMISFFVRDTGIGIPKDQQKVIFERFRQADDSSTRKYGGTGLGLWVSRNLVELMGGSVFVESDPGRGSVFYVDLPLDKDVEIPEGGREIPEEKKTVADWRDKKILIAEDNDSNYEFLKAVLSVKKAVLIRAYDGKEALDLIMEHEDVDLVLMDIQMPVLNGYEATKLIKKMKPDLPIIAQTAYAMSEDRNRIMQAGCDEYIAKPIQPRKMLSLIEKFLIKEEES